MTIFTNNIYEKSFTPYYASLAPKQFCHKHIMQRKPNRVSMFWQDSRSISMMRWVRRYILLNTKWFHMGILLFAFSFEHFCKGTTMRIYKMRNQDKSLEWAQKHELDYIKWRKENFPDEFEEEEEAEVEVAVEEDDD